MCFILIALIVFILKNNFKRVTFYYNKLKPQQASKSVCEKELPTQEVAVGPSDLHFYLPSQQYCRCG